MMKSARTYTLLKMLLIVLLVAIILTGFLQIGFEHFAVGYLILGIAVTVGTFLIARYFFLSYVANKPETFPKTFHSYTMSQKKAIEKADVGERSFDLNQEEKIWTDHQSEEIKKLRQLEKYRRDFLGNVSHELKTPIFNIQGYILTLLDGGIEDESINKLYLKRAEKSTNRLISIVDDLDSIARLESGEFKLQKEIFNLAKVIEEVIEYQEMQARQKNIKIGFEGNFNKPIKVNADKKLIMEVLSNLISNSIKYGKDGGKTTIGIIDKGENILVDITDNGIGIEEKNLPRIFERFYRVDKSRSRESGGTGLGLAIVKHTIQAHHQTITVRSKDGQGSTFIFSLEKV